MPQYDRKPWRRSVLLFAAEIAISAFVAGLMIGLCLWLLSLLHIQYQ